MQQPTTVPMGKRQILLHSNRGEVVGEKKWTSTQVSSRGGGGYVTQGTGWVSGAKIESTVTEHDQFFVRTPDGNEIPVTVMNSKLAIRTGHDVSLVWGKWAGKTDAHLLAIHNHTTTQTTTLDGNLRAFAESPLWVILSLGGMLAGLAIVGWSILESGLNTAGHVLFVAIGAALAWPAFRSYRKGRARQNGLGHAVGTMLRDIEAHGA